MRTGFHKDLPALQVLLGQALKNDKPGRDNLLKLNHHIYCFLRYSL